jgi:type II secretory pathway pseudopilin PulG
MKTQFIQRLENKLGSKKSSNAGFSLIPIFLGQQNQAKDAAAKSDLANAKVAMISYSVSNSGAWASATSQLTTYGFVQSDGVTSVTIASTPPTGAAFCISAVSGANNTFHVKDTGGVLAGPC